MAYLTHISGQAFAEYFARGQSWGDGGMQAALVRQFDLNSRAEFLQEFAKQAIAAGPEPEGQGRRHPRARNPSGGDERPGPRTIATIETSMASSQRA